MRIPKMCLKQIVIPCGSRDDCLNYPLEPNLSRICKN